MLENLKPLNLPKANLILKSKEGILFVKDLIRAKYLVLTPEEWVRQHLISFFINQLGYPKTLFSIERGLNFYTRKKRTDLLVLDRKGKPWLLVECKASEVAITEKTLQQVLAYNSYWRCPYVMMSNGLEHQIFESNEESNFLKKLSDFPIYPIE